MHALTRAATAGAALSLIVAGCGEPQVDAESDSAAVSENGDAEDDVTEAVDRAVASFVPEADQFGVERFKIVYEMEGQQTGTRTLWVEDHGDRVAVEERLTIYGVDEHKMNYWDGEATWLKQSPDAAPARTGIRTKASEPSSFAVTPASDLETIGYRRTGEKTVAGRTCEVWVHDGLNYEGCRADHIEYEFLNGAGTPDIIQRATAIEFVEGEGIPDRLKALAE